MEWRFELRIQLTETLTDAQLSELMESAARDDWNVVRDPIGIALITYGPTDQPAETLRILWAEAAVWLAGQQRFGAVVVGRVMTDELYETETLQSDTPELLAATDVAEVLGVSRQRVHQLHSEHADFPAPYARLGSGPIWTRPVIEAFGRRWTRKPGRPSTRTAAS